MMSDQWRRLVPHPCGFEVATVRDGAWALEGLLPAEHELVAPAVPKRQAEFAAGRRCARAALAQLGVPEQPIVKDESGAPCWPEGIVGTISHSAGLAVAAVARAPELLSIGIDVEPAEALPAHVDALVLRPEEMRCLARLAARRPGIPWDRLTFSAKESVFKTWFPLARTWLDFLEADVSFSIDSAHSGSFRAGLCRELLLPRGAVDVLHGRWSIDDGVIFTVCHVAE